MYAHPIIKAAMKLDDEVELPATIQNAMFIAALFLAKRDQILPADIERLALILFMNQQGQNAIDRISLDKVRLDYKTWRIVMFKDAPLNEWRIEITDNIMAGIVRCSANGHTTIRRYLVKNELSTDDPSVVLP